MLQSSNNDAGTNRQLSSFLKRLGTKNIAKQETRDGETSEANGVRSNEEPDWFGALHTLLLDILPANVSNGGHTNAGDAGATTEELAFSLVKLFRGLNNDEAGEMPIDTLLPFAGTFHTDAVLRQWKITDTGGPAQVSEATATKEQSPATQHPEESPDESGVTGHRRVRVEEAMDLLNDHDGHHEAEKTDPSADRVLKETTVGQTQARRSLQVLTEGGVLTKEVPPENVMPVSTCA